MRIRLGYLPVIMVTVSMSLAVLPVFANAPVEEAQAEGMGVSVPGTEVVSQTASSESLSFNQPQASMASEQPSSRSSLPQATWEDADEMDSNRRYQPPATTDAPSAVPTPNLARLSQQVNNMVRMNWQAKLATLQKQVARLRGEIQVQAHEIKRMKTSQRQFYTELSHRIDSSKRRMSMPEMKSKTRHQAAVNQPVAAVEASGHDHAVYQHAFDALMSKQYSRSRENFKRYLKDYPAGRYRSNALYWLAEIALVNRQYNEAESALKKIIKTYPTSGKYADARYKLAVTHLKMKRLSQAKQELSELSKAYSGKTVGRLASIALEQLMLDSA